MLVKEALIDDVLCYQVVPKGQWIAYTLEQVTRMYVDNKRVYDDCYEVLVNPLEC